MKPGKDEKGERLKLYKRIHVKIIVGEKVMRHDFCAPAQRGYSETNIDETIEKVIEHLDQKFPTLEFRQVDILPNVVNFIACGVRPKQGAQDEAKTVGGGKDGEGGQSSMPEPGPPDRSAGTPGQEHRAEGSGGSILPDDNREADRDVPSVRLDA